MARRMQGRALVVAVVGVLLLAVLGVGVGLLVTDGGGDSDTSATTTTPDGTTTRDDGTTTTDAVATTSPGGTTVAGRTALRVQLLEGEKLAVGARAVPATRAVGRAAMRELLRGPNPFEAGVGYTTAIPDDTELRDIALADGVATVDLTAAFGSGGGSASMQARVAQVVFTMTQFDTVDAVSFRIDGRAVDALGGEGLVLSEPQRRADWYDWLPDVFVESPAAGATVDSPLRLTGLALTFEATWRIEVVDGDGIIVADQVVTAGGGDQFRPFDVTVPFTTARPGLGEIVLSYDSAEDGTRVVVDEVPVRFP